MGNADLPTLKDAINKDLNPNAKLLYGSTGGFQAIQGEMFGKYQIDSWQDLLVESFAGTHDLLGGQSWDLYDRYGNTTRGRITQTNPNSNSPNKYDGKISNVTATAAIPAAAPFAISDLMSPDVLQILLKIGGY